ncbi:MAG: helix-turn-helix domain-containing protein [Candidatus Bathyarchaeia archaeon]
MGVVSSKSVTRGEKIRHHILKTAAKLFALYGFKSVTVRQIASKAKVNQAAIHYYFRDKFNLYCEAARNALLSIQQLDYHRWIQLIETSKTQEERYSLLSQLIQEKIHNHLEVLQTKDRWKQKFLLRLILDDSEVLSEIPRWLEKDAEITRSLFQQLNPHLSDSIYKLANIHMFGQIAIYILAEIPIRNFLDYHDQWKQLIPLIHRLIFQSVCSFLSIPIPDFTPQYFEKQVLGVTNL